MSAYLYIRCLYLRQTDSLQDSDLFVHQAFFVPHFTSPLSGLPDLCPLAGIPYSLPALVRSLPFSLLRPHCIPASSWRLDTDLFSLCLALQATVAQRAWHKPACRLHLCQSQRVCACSHRSPSWVGKPTLPRRFSPSSMLKHIGDFLNRNMHLPPD